MKENKEPILIILILFILAGLAYSPAKKSGVLDKNMDTQNTSTIGADTSANYAGNASTAEEIRRTQEEIENLEKNLREETEKRKRSPYYGKITMSGISGLYGDNPDEEYISLYTSLQKNETVKITGWYLKSEVTGYYAVIGKASLLPFPFNKTESDIILQQGDSVIITKGFSPIGISFRTNLCTGYFEENRAFIPNLSKECPLPKDETLPVFSTIHDRQEECLDLIDNIPRCTTKGSSYIRDLPDTVADSCKNYITTQINYNSCVAKHFSDTNFPGQEYRVYLNKFGPLWRQRSDKINLHDQNGLIVDTISY